MNWEELGFQVLETLLPILTAAIIALVGYGIAYLRKQAQAIQHQAARDAANNALFEAERVLRDAINYTSQTFVQDLKAAREDGKLTKEEAQQAMERAKNYFMLHITKESKSILESAMGPIQDWLEDAIEAKLGEQKETIAKVRKITDPLSSAPVN